MKKKISKTQKNTTSTAELLKEIRELIVSARKAIVRNEYISMKIHKTLCTLRLPVRGTQTAAP